MDEHKWIDRLQKEKVNEFSFHPHAFTPLKGETGFKLPPIELEWSGESDEEESADAGGQMPSWIKNLSFTIGGVTIGAAAMYGLVGGTPTPPACPTPIVQQQQTTPVVTPVSVPTQSGSATTQSSSPAGGAAPAATSSATDSSASGVR